MGGAIRQYIAGCAASLGLMMQGTALGWPSPTLVKLDETGFPMRLNDSEKSWMVSLLYIGNFISPLPSGYLMDRFGRKRTITFASIISLLGWILAFFATEASMLYASRFAHGLWAGISFTVVTMYLGEISEPRVRGSLSTLIQIMIYFGVFYEYIIGPFVSFKTLIIMNAAVPVAFVFLMLFVPESPYWYLMKDRQDDAIKSLCWLRNVTVSDKVKDEAAVIEQSVKEQMKNKKTLKDLIATPGSRKGLFIVQILAIFQRMSGISGLMAYTSISLPKEGINPDTCVIIMSIVWIASVFISTALVDSWGRRPLLSASCVGCGCAMAAAAVWFYLRYETEIYVSSTHWVPFICFLIYGVFFSIGLGPIASTVQSELFPSNTKGLASAVTTISLGVTSFVMNKIYLSIAKNIGMYFNFVIFSLASFVCLFFVLLCLLETKGKTLEDIQDQLQSKNKRSTNI